MSFLRRKNSNGIVRRRTPSIRPHGKTIFTVSQRGPRITGRVTRWLIAIGIFVVIAATYGVLFYAPTFRIEQPKFEGLERVTESELMTIANETLDQTSYLIFPNRSLLAAPTKKLEKQLLEANSAIASVSVHKELPNTLKFIIEERQPNAIWSSDNAFFYVDERGVAYADIERSESREVEIPVIVDEQKTPTVVGDRVITVEALNFVIGAYDELGRTSDVGINFFIAPSKLAPDLILVTTEGWKVFFDATTVPQVQVVTLTEVLKNEVPDRRNLDYIDLRVAGRVFVK